MFRGESIRWGLLINRLIFWSMLGVIIFYVLFFYLYFTWMSPFLWDDLSSELKDTFLIIVPLLIIPQIIILLFTGYQIRQLKKDAAQKDTDDFVEEE